jgi:nitrite reductase/ring-hydroxylating ferredoxin subunit
MASWQRECCPRAPHMLCTLTRAHVDVGAHTHTRPHPRLAPLSEGRLEGGNLMCSYHGWQFDSAGKCVDVPQVRACACGVHASARVHQRTCPSAHSAHLTHIARRARAGHTSAGAGRPRARHRLRQPALVCDVIPHTCVPRPALGVAQRGRGRGGGGGGGAAAAE